MLRATRHPTIEAHGRSGQGSEQGYTSRQDTLPWAYQPPCTLTHTVPGFDSFSQAHWPDADYVAHRAGSKRALFCKLDFVIKLVMLHIMPLYYNLHFFPLFMIKLFTIKFYSLPFLHVSINISFKPNVQIQTLNQSHFNQIRLQST